MKYSELRLVISPESLILRLRDDCRRFDLIERYKLIDPEDPASNIGLRIVFAKADEVNYSSSLDLNNICIRFSRNKPGTMAEDSGRAKEVQGNCYDKEYSI